MKKFFVKDLMIPISNYVTVGKTDTLVNVLQALEGARQAAEHAHRDAIVVDDDGTFLGKVTMIDIFRALEPNYKKMMSGNTAGTGHPRCHSCPSRKRRGIPTCLLDLLDIRKPRLTISQVLICHLRPIQRQRHQLR